MKNLTLLLFSFVFLMSNLAGQDSLSTGQQNTYRHYFGVTAGFTTGLGATYRFMPQKSGIQVTCLPLYDEQNTYVSLSATYFREIRQYSEIRLLFYASNHITNFFSEDNSYAYNAGLGVGMEIGVNYIVLDFMLGYAGLDIFDHFKTRPVIDTGLYFRF